MSIGIDEFDDLVEFIRGFGWCPEEHVESLRAYLDHTIESKALPYAAGKELENPDSGFLGVSHDFLYAIADQRHLIERPAVKWYNPNAEIGDRRGTTRLTKKKGICFHHTAVAGGFGTHKSVRKDLTKQLELLQPGQIDLCKVVEVNRELTSDELVRLHALGARYRGAGPVGKHNKGVPYHVLRGANSVLYLNLPFDWVTWHGNGANNDYLGFGWDAKSRKDSPEPDDMIQDILFLADLMTNEGHTVEEFVTHSMYTRKPDDPWREYIEQVMMPAAEKLGAKVVTDKKFGSGRTIAETLAA